MTAKMLGDILDHKENSDNAIEHQLDLLLGQVDKNRIICFFEGNEDEYFYLNDIRKRGQSKNRAVKIHICKGKDRVLKFHTLFLEKKTISLFQEMLLFFIDKDFDGYLLKNRIKDSILFETDGYSFENYLATEEMLSILLENSKNRDTLLEAYKKAHQDFLDFMHPILQDCVNFRKEKINFRFPTEQEFKKMFTIKEDFSFLPLITTSNFLSKFDIASEIKVDCRILLDKADSIFWLRGKYAFLFFQKFCQKIQNEFNAVDKQASNNKNLFIQILSDKINFPLKLAQFLDDNFKKL